MEQILDHLEPVLHPSANLGLRPLMRLGQCLDRALGHLGDRLAAPGHAPVDVAANLALGLGPHNVRPLFKSGAAGIDKHHLLVAVQHSVRMRHVVFIGRRGVKAVHQPRVGVRADVRLHPASH